MFNHKLIWEPGGRSAQIGQLGRAAFARSLPRRHLFPNVKQSIEHIDVCGEMGHDGGEVTGKMGMGAVIRQLITRSTRKQVRPNKPGGLGLLPSLCLRLPSLHRTRYWMNCDAATKAVGPDVSTGSNVSFPSGSQGIYVSQGPGAARSIRGHLSRWALPGKTRSLQWKRASMLLQVSCEAGAIARREVLVTAWCARR